MTLPRLLFSEEYDELKKQHPDWFEVRVSDDPRPETIAGMNYLYLNHQDDEWHFRTGHFIFKDEDMAMMFKLNYG